MKISRRLSLAAAVAVAIAVALASLAAYFAVRSKLRSEVDSSLQERASAIQMASAALGSPPLDLPKPAISPSNGAKFGGAAGAIQLVSATGHLRSVPGNSARLPVDAETKQLATVGGQDVLKDEVVDGDHLRVLSSALPGGGAVQVARPLGEIDSVLHQLVLLLVLITAAGVGLAAVLGWLVSRASLAPIRRFTEETETVLEESDASRRMTERGSDELTRLARSYNSTLESLERSVLAQRQLVSDASHELRTPLATLKTNIEVLLRDEDKLATVDREDLARDLVDQIDELTVLVDDVVQLARRGEHEKATEDVALDDVLMGAIARARRHAPGVEFRVDTEREVVTGVAERLDRAIYNLLDNAAKWSPAAGVVDVSLQRGILSVQDDGPGIAAEDLPHVFERFYRSPNARGSRGSGLGLAIVKQVAESHGAEVVARNRSGGGTVMELRFSAYERVPANP